VYHRRRCGAAGIGEHEGREVSAQVTALARHTAHWHVVARHHLHRRHIAATRTAMTGRTRHTGYRTVVHRTRTGVGNRKAREVAGRVTGIASRGANRDVITWRDYCRG